MEYLFFDFLYIFGHSFVDKSHHDESKSSIVHGDEHANKIEVTSKMLNFTDKKFRMHIQEFLMYLEPRKFTPFSDKIQE
jgi:hypothetical protein